MLSHGRPPADRSGYTLLELMIVLAILVTVTAVAWPSIARRIKLIGPREAALQVKADLAEARERAIHTGEAWAWRIERGGANYEFGPVSAFRDRAMEQHLTPSNTVPPTPDPFGTLLSDEQLLSDAPASLQSPPVTRATRLRRNSLPPGMVFDDGFAHGVSEANVVRVPSVAQPSFAEPTTPPPFTTPNAAPNLHWKFAVILQPDGRATESEIRLKEQSTQNAIRLRVRRFTGGVTIDKVESKPPVIVSAAEDPLLQETESLFQNPESSGTPQQTSTDSLPLVTPQEEQP